VRFIVPGRPASKPNGQRAHRHPTADYEEAVGLYASRALPAAWPQTERYHLQVGILYADKRVADNTNVLKAIEDGLTGVVWHDDAQVDAQSTLKKVQDGRDESLAVVRVELLPDALDAHAIPTWMEGVLG
jgi:Holliday junction resolvase RusA-like endonuclease